jgi:hypothetical protein
MQDAKYIKAKRGRRPKPKSIIAVLNTANALAE